jgi:hypothetical protein
MNIQDKNKQDPQTPIHTTQNNNQYTFHTDRKQVMNNKMYQHSPPESKSKMPWQWERAWIGMPAVILMLVAYVAHNMITLKLPVSEGISKMTGEPILWFLLVWMAGHSWQRLKHVAPKVDLTRSDWYADLLFPKVDEWIVQQPRGLPGRLQKRPALSHFDAEGAQWETDGATISSHSGSASAAKNNKKPGLTGIAVNEAFQLYSIPNA